MTATIENIVGLKSAIEHAKSLKPYSNMGISAALVVEMGDTLAAQAKEIEQLKAQVEALKSKSVQDLIEPLTDGELSLLICNVDEGDWNSLMYRDCWAKGFAEGVREREAINQERLVAKGGE